jgi:Met-zincin/Domain of unknown function (DUF5117)
MLFRKIACTMAAILCVSLFAYAQEKSNPKTTKTTTSKKADTTKPKKETLADKVKSSRKTEGLFTLYQDTSSGSVHMYIKNDQLGKEFIYQSFSMGGPAQLFLNQNMLRETWVFSIQKKHNKIEFARKNTSFYYDPKNAVSKAANVDVGETVFYSDTALIKDSSGYLVAVDGLMLSDKLDQVKPIFPPTVPPTAFFNLGNLNPTKSIYEKIRSYPNNTDIVVSLAYDNPTPFNWGGRDITDARYVRVKMQHSFLEIPQNDYKPRFDDPRVGFFTQEMDDLTTSEIINYRDLINRWHLKKKDPDAALSEPVEPIVWWVENTTPVELRQVIIDAGLRWNEAFEKAGFKNAVVMKIMPDTATWDPADIRYNVIRWVSSGLGYAIGPSFVNPRTGQILGSDITIDHGFLSGIISEQDLYKAFSSNSFAGNIDPSLQDLPFFKHWKNCMIAQGLRGQIGMGTTALETMDAPPVELENLRNQFFSFLVLHEMGHTMGLNHNMKSSQMLSPEELTNKDIARKLGVTGSVMDYPGVNVSLDRSKQGDYYTTKTGPYDWWAIEYGYTQFKEGEEAAGLKKILDKSTDPQLTFGNDADVTFYSRGVDPRVMVWDMSNDMVRYGSDRFQLVNQMMGKLKEKYSTPGKPYTGLLVKYYHLIDQRWMMASGISRYIGGIYVDRSFVGQANSSKPYVPVPVEYQKKAMAALNQYFFSPNAFEADTQLFPYLQMQRRGFNFWNNTEDPKPQQIAIALQMSVLGHILNPVTMQRMNTTTLYGNTYSSAEVLSDLVNGIYADDQKSDVNLYRQNLQTEFVKALTSIANAPAGPYDNASKAAAHYSLRKIKSILEKATSKNEQTIAHRSNLNFLIDKALVVK